MPDDPHVPGWPESMPAGLLPGDSGYEHARDLERRQVLNNVRHLAARVELLGMQLRASDTAIAGLRRDSERSFKDIGERLDGNTVLTGEVKALLETVKGGSLLWRVVKNTVLGLGALAGAFLAIWAVVELLKK